MTSHIIAILKQIAIFAENDSHHAFSECVNERTVREKKYLWEKCTELFRRRARLWVDQFPYAKISKDLRIKYSEAPEVVTEKMGQELIFGVFLLKNWT